MNLCIDQGNSRTKVAIIGDEGKLLHTFIYKSFASADVERLFSLYPITDSIISSVINIEPAVVNSLHRLSAHLPMPHHVHFPSELPAVGNTKRHLPFEQSKSSLNASTIVSPSKKLSLFCRKNPSVRASESARKTFRPSKES